LFYSLAEKRVDLLSIAGQTEKLPGIYEFPRELRKLRQLLVQFLSTWHALVSKRQPVSARLLFLRCSGSSD